MPHDSGVAFRVWAPNADRVSVVGDFNDWDAGNGAMEAEPGGCWYRDCAEAVIGDQYKYEIVNGDQVLRRVDPRVREVVNSVGNGIVHDPDFDWQDDDFEIANWNELVIYETHVGTFRRSDDDSPGDFEDLIAGLDHLKKLGVNALQIMPIAEFAGDLSWGYNPAHIYAIESAYGGPRQFKRLVREAHRRGFAVILDVVYNHFGPSDLDLWQFDGWHENDKGGIYFYNDQRSTTPWGDTRPDYGRGEVRAFIRDNAMMWFDDYHVDGLRYDMTLYIRSVDGAQDIPDGWGLTQWVNREIYEKYPKAITIAEDLQNNDYLTKPQEDGGAGFSTQWDAGFVHPVRDVLIAPDDGARDLHKIIGALEHQYNGRPFQRVVYTESHDEVANGKSRVPSEIDEADPDGRFAKKRSVLGAALTLTAPGIPMLFQGQELLQDGWFQDTEELDWENREKYPGILRLYRDLIALRRNREGQTRGLTGERLQILHANHHDKVLAFRRWDQGGSDDDTVVLMNFSHTAFEAYRFGLPADGKWTLRFNSDAETYSDHFDGHPVGDIAAEEHRYDGLEFSGVSNLGAYAALIFSKA
nr:alpha-amylase family glycosyl hydrolase [Roseimaritima sediminicola]